MTSAVRTPWWLDEDQIPPGISAVLSYVVLLAERSPLWVACDGTHGQVTALDFRYADRLDAPASYRWGVAQKWLRLSVRTPDAQDSWRPLVAELKAHFPSFRQDGNLRGHWTIRVRTVDDVLLLTCLSDKTALPLG